MDQTLEKLITWLRNEFILLKRDLANYILRKVSDMTDSMGDIAKSQKELVAELKRQKTLPMTITHEMKNLPAIKFPDFPKFAIPEIRIPEIKIPMINVPKPEVTVNVEDREDKALAKLLTQVLKKLDGLKSYDLWNDIGAKTPVPVILVDENAKYYKAEGGGAVTMVGGGGSSNIRPINNVQFGGDRITVPTPGTAVQLPNILCSEVTITAFENNAKTIYVGGSNVVAVLGSQKGSALSPLGTITLRIDNLNKIYIDAQQASDGVTYSWLS